MAHSLSDKIVRNTVYNSIGRFWGILVGFVLTPYIISCIGLERFGVWAIIGVITGYFGLLDFGIGFSFTKYIAEYHAKKEYDNLNGVINTGFTLYLCLAVISVAIIVVLREPLLTLLNIPSALYHEAVIVLTIAVALFGAANAMAPFAAVQAGLQRMDIANNIAIAVSFVNIAGTVFVLKNGYGLIGLMMNNAAVFGITAVINALVAFRILPTLRFRPFVPDRALVKKILCFGANVQVSKISSMIANQTDKIYIACFLSIGLVTFYQLGATVVFCLISVLAILTSAIMPAFSEIDARGERVRLVESYLRSVRCLSFFTVPLFLFVIISARDIMTIWMGQGFERTGPVIQILAFAWLLATIAQVSVYLSFAIEKPQFMSAGSLMVVSLNLLLSFIFIRRFGFLGAAWGTLFATNIGTSYFIYTLNRYLGVPVKKYAAATVPYLAVGILASAAIVCADHALKALHAHPGRVQMLLVFIARGAVFSVMYLALVIRFKLIGQADIDLIARRMPAGWIKANGPR